MTDDEAARLAERAAAARFVLQADAGCGDVRRGTGFTAMISGVFANDANGVVSDPAFPHDRALVAELFAWFAEAHAPAAWTVREPDGQLTRLLRDEGAQPDASAVWDWAELRAIDLSPPPPPGVTIDPLRDRGDLDDWLNVVDACAGFEDDVDRQRQADLIRAVGFDHPHLRRWLARYDGVPVGTAAALIDDSYIFLDGLGVRPEFRRMGIGGALARVRLGVAHAAGATAAVAALSPDGRALYRAMGFRSVPVRPDTWFFMPLEP